MGYSIEEIKRSREYIRNTLIDEIFYKKGNANFTSINGNDIEYIFNLYDITFFQGQIREKIDESGAKINFLARSRLFGYAGVCGYKYLSGVRYYFLDIAPNVLESVLKRYPAGVPMAAGIGCSDRLSCTQLIMEHEIVHLLCTLWGYTEKANLPGKAKDLYGPHGLLFQCLIHEYFGHTNFQHDLGLTDVVTEFIDPKTLPSGFVAKYRNKNIISAAFQNWSNSCYLDSVLMVLFDSASPFWRRNLMDVNVDSIKYEGKVCTDNSNVDTDEKVRAMAKRIQAQIKTDYTALHAENRIIKCTILRELLALCLPSMKPKGQWVIFNTGAVYDALVAVFPDLAIDIPYQIYRWAADVNEYIADTVDFKSEATLTMWDYMDPLEDHELDHDYKVIRWDLISAPVLVFYNGGMPRIRKFNQIGEENGYVYIEGERHDFLVNKARQFDYTIIDDRYRLVGVITLEGVSLKSEGGTHYTAHFLGVDDNWYYYNDAGATVIKVDKLPDEGVWMEKGGSMPSMYFYQKIRNPNIELIPARRKPVEKKAPKAEFIKGDDFDYKKLESVAGDEIAYLYFIYDRSSGYNVIRLLEKYGNVNNISYTNIEDGVRMWKVNADQVDGFERELRRVASIPTESGTVTKKYVIDDVKVGQLYKNVDGIKIYNYTDKTFIVVLPDECATTFTDGLSIRNVKYNIAMPDDQQARIYHKNQLGEIEQRISKL